MEGIVPDSLYESQEEAFRDFEDYRDQLINENGYSRKQALCEAYHHLSVLWSDDIMQQVEPPFDSKRANEEAEYIKTQAKKYERLSDRYCDD